MHSTRSQFSQATDTELLSSKPVDEPTYSEALKKNFIEENISQAEIIKIFSPKPVEASTSRIENRKVYFSTDVNDIWESGAIPLLQKESPTTSRSMDDIFQSSTLVEEITRRFEHFSSTEKMVPFMTQAKIESISKNKFKPREDFNNGSLSHASSTKEMVKNDLSCGQNVVELVRNYSLSGEQIGNGSTAIEVPYSGLRVDLRQDERISTSGPRKLGLENLLSSIEIYESCTTGKPLLNKHKNEIENIHPLAKSDANYLPAENSRSKVYPIPNDISFKYKQIYYEKNPCVYDFAIKLMAHIEFLNDKSWKMTHSYFSYNVHKTVKYLWNGVKEFRIEFQTINLDKLKQLLSDLSTLCQRTIFKLIEFLGCCILMCQIGVEARKRKFKEFPVRVIALLRERIQEFENSHRNCIEPIVENIAERIVQLF